MRRVTAALAAVPLLVALAACNSSSAKVADCTVSNPHMTFTGGEHAIGFFDILCTHKPQSIYVKVILEVYLSRQEKWKPASKALIITHAPPVGHKQPYSLRGACYPRTKMRMYGDGHGTSHDGGYNQGTLKSKAFKTGSCGK